MGIKNESLHDLKIIVFQEGDTQPLTQVMVFKLLIFLRFSLLENPISKMPELGEEKEALRSGVSQNTKNYLR